MPTIACADQVAPLGVVGLGDQPPGAISSAVSKSPASQAAKAVASRGSGSLAAVGLAEPRPGREALGEKVSPERLQQLQRLPGLAAGEQDPARAGARLRVRGIELERLAQRRLVAGGGELVGGRRDELVEEALDLRRRDRAGELGDDLAVAKRLHRRDPPDAEARREALVGVDVDLRQLDLAVALADRGLERRAELAARAAPLGPEVDDDGQLAGALDHLGR